jgi:hypothetical protein
MSLEAFGEAFAKSFAESSGQSLEACRAAVKLLSEDVLREGAESLLTNRSISGFSKDIIEVGGAEGSEAIAGSFTRGASKAVAEAVSENLVESSAQEGLNSAVNKLGAAGEFSPKGNEGWAKVVNLLLDDAKTSALKANLKDPSIFEATLTGIKNNWGKLLIAGVTIEVVTVWLATGNGIQSLVDAVGNVITEIAKNLIGALAGVATSLTEPIGQGIGSTLKTVGIILGVVAGVGLLIYIIYLIIQKVRADKAAKKV